MSTASIPPPWWRETRWQVLAMLFFVTVINFVDRQALSVAAPILREKFRLSNTDYGHIVAGLTFGLMIGEFPMGWLADRFGVRIVLPAAVAWWSTGNALHAFANSKWQFAALRFWLGTGECANFSSGVKIVSEWFPAKERALAVGIFNGGSMIGSIVAPPLLVAIMVNFGWQMAFIVPSALGFAWALAWRKVYPPASPRGAEPSDPPTVPSNRELLHRSDVWALMLTRLLVGPVVQFYIFWLPEYLFRERGLSLTSIGLFAWIPFFFGDVGSIGGGWLAGLLIRRGWTVTAARRFTMGLGAGLCLFSLGIASARSPAGALAFICIVLLGHTCLSANMFARISDLLPQEATSRTTGLTGIASGFSGFLFPVLTGVLVDRFGYSPVFLITALMPAAGVFILFAMTRGR